MNLTERTYQLRVRTHELLMACDLSYNQISEGSGVGYHWLNKFSQNQIKRPGLDKIEPLHDFLASHVASSSNPSGRRTLAKSSKHKQPRININRQESRVRKSPNSVRGAA